MSLLQRAAEHVSAAKVGPGRWAHYDDGWYIVTSAELRTLCAYLDDPDENIAGDAYSHWCAGTAAIEMPHGWSPDDALPDASRPRRHP